MSELKVGCTVRVVKDIHEGTADSLQEYGVRIGDVGEITEIQQPNQGTSCRITVLLTTQKEIHFHDDELEIIEEK